MGNIPVKGCQSKTKQHASVTKTQLFVVLLPKILCLLLPEGVPSYQRQSSLDRDRDTHCGFYTRMLCAEEIFLYLLENSGFKSQDLRSHLNIATCIVNGTQICFQRVIHICVDFLSAIKFQLILGPVEKEISQVFHFPPSLILTSSDIPVQL